MASDEYIWIYTIPTLQPTTELTMVDAPAHSAIHVIPLAMTNFRGGELSLPCIDLQETRLVFLQGLSSTDLLSLTRSTSLLLFPVY